MCCADRLMGHRPPGPVADRCTRRACRLQRRPCCGPVTGQRPHHRADTHGTPEAHQRDGLVRVAVGGLGRHTRTRPPETTESIGARRNPRPTPRTPEPTRTRHPPHRLRTTRGPRRHGSSRGGDTGPRRHHPSAVHRGIRRGTQQAARHTGKPPVGLTAAERAAAAYLPRPAHRSPRSGGQAAITRLPVKSTIATSASTAPSAKRASTSATRPHSTSPAARSSPASSHSS